MNERLMPDPSGRIMTRDELETCVSLLRRFENGACASTVLTFDEPEQRSLVELSRARYVESISRPTPTKLDAPFGWDRIRTTSDGLAYLRQITAIRECQARPGVNG